MPNGLFRHHGGGIEHLTTIPATINEMLMQSFEGIIRPFPCWDRNKSASFENLRADGAFLVSAENKGGKITSLKIKSLNGRTCRDECSDIRNVIKESDKTPVQYKKDGNTVIFETDADTSYILI